MDSHLPWATYMSPLAGLYITLALLAKLDRFASRDFMAEP
jgi:hypothetical protein